jgi:hypothetical protein
MRFPQKELEPILKEKEEGKGDTRVPSDQVQKEPKKFRTQSQIKIELQINT